MISELIIEKERIFNKDINIFLNQIKEMDEHIHSILKDKGWTVNFNIEWLNKLKDIVIINKEELSTIPPEKRIEALQYLLASKHQSLEDLKVRADGKHASLIKDIDEQIEYYRGELKRINEELEKEKNPAKRSFKDWKKGRIEKKGAEFD